MGEYARRLHRKLAAKADNLPSGPPMSPLTGSFFWMWALYDLRIGKSTDTMGPLALILGHGAVLLSNSARQWPGSVE